MAAITRDERTHAHYSPSASHQWMHCADSINVNKGGGLSSVYAEEGTAAHNLLDTCLTLDTSPYAFLDKLVYKSYPVTIDMADAVAQAIDWIKGYLATHPRATVQLDLKVDPARLIGAPPGRTSGTLDVSLCDPEREVVVIDYKHGVNVGVDVLDNSQLMQYLLGYYAQHCVSPYKKYRIVIIQPRHRHTDGPVREQVVTHAELMEYRTELKKRIGVIEKSPTHRAAGPWCTWCNAAGRCNALRDYNLERAQVEFSDMEKSGKALPRDPKDMTAEQVFLIAAHAGEFEKWLKAVYANAMELLLKGRKSKHVKLVDGRGSRGWVPDKEPVIMSTLYKLGFKINEYAPRSLVGMGAVEDMFKRRIRKSTGKARIPGGTKVLPPVVTKLIRYNPGPLHIARKTDPRPEVIRGSEFANKPLPTTKARSNNGKK